MNPGIKVSAHEIQEMINNEVLKREVIGSDSGEEAQKQVAKFYKSQSRAKSKKTKVVADTSSSDEPPSSEK